MTLVNVVVALVVVLVLVLVAGVVTGVWWPLLFVSAGSLLLRAVLAGRSLDSTSKEQA